MQVEGCPIAPLYDTFHPKYTPAYAASHPLRYLSIYADQPVATNYAAQRLTRLTVRISHTLPTEEPQNLRTFRQDPEANKKAWTMVAGPRWEGSSMQEKSIANGQYTSGLIPA